MIYQAEQPKSIGEAGKDFLVHLTQHFENDQPDVLVPELNENSGFVKNEPHECHRTRRILRP